MDKALENLKPELNLSMTVDMEGLSENREVTNLGLGNRTTGPNLLLTLSGAWPVRNNAARGALTVARSTHQYARIRAMEMARTIRTSLAMTLNDLKRTLEGQVYTRKAELYYRNAMNNEQKN